MCHTAVAKKRKLLKSENEKNKKTGLTKTGKICLSKNREFARQQV